MKKKKVALHHVINPEKVLRGPDFFFALFHKEYKAYPKAQYDLYFVIKTSSATDLERLFKEWNISTEKIIFLENHNNRLKTILEWLDFVKVILTYRFHVWMICTFRSPEEQMLQLKTLRTITKWQGAKMIFVVTYALVPQAFDEGTKYDCYERDRWKYGALLSSIKFDAFYSWYQNFQDWAQTCSFLAYKPYIQVLQSRFCNTEKFKPEAKKKWIVFASALEAYKHPMTVVNAAIQLHAEYPERMKEWKFFIVGTGALLEEINAKVQAHQLQDKMEVITGVRDISTIVNQSMCYVSAQEEENFPSLAMNECMAAGNAIIARNVGRTDLFVHHEKNGYLVNASDERALEEGIQRFVLLPEKEQFEMGRQSRWLCEHVHTPENFILQTEKLWSKVLGTAKT